MNNPPVCRVCGSSQRPLRCAQCKSVWYCNAQHQQHDWPNHRQYCQQVGQQNRQLQQERQQQFLQQQQSLLHTAQPTNSFQSSHIDNDISEISSILDDGSIHNVLADDLEIDDFLAELTNDVFQDPDSIKGNSLTTMEFCEPQPQLQLDKNKSAYFMRSNAENCYLPPKDMPYSIAKPRGPAQNLKEGWDRIVGPAYTLCTWWAGTVWQGSLNQGFQAQFLKLAQSGSTT